jgi:hypothetical protein
LDYRANPVFPALERARSSSFVVSPSASVC